jgi:hypothetical protein
VSAAADKEPRCDYCTEEGRWIRWLAETPLDEAYRQGFFGPPVPGPTARALRACDAHKDRIESQLYRRSDR